MSKLTVRFDDERYEDLRELAKRKGTSMAELLRYALDETFEDDLDVIAGERGWAEYIANPASAISLDDYIRSRGIQL